MSTLLWQAPKARSRPFWASIIACLLFFIALSFFVLWSQDTHALAMDPAIAVIPFVVAGLGLLAFLRVTDRRDKVSWYLVAVSLLSMGLAEGLWILNPAFTVVQLPFSPLGDFLHLLFYPVAFAAIMARVPRSRKFFGFLLPSFDAFLVSVSAVALSWQLMLGPTIMQASEPLLAAYPVGDLLILFAVLSLFLKTPDDKMRLSDMCLSSGLLFIMVVDSLYPYEVVHGGYVAGAVWDPLWVLSYGLAGLAALSAARSGRLQAQGSRPAGEGMLKWSPWLRLVLPYTALPAAALLLYSEYGSGGQAIAGSGIWVLWLSAVLAFMVMLRVLITLAENARLSRSLSALSCDLKARVDQRTGELAQRTEELGVLNGFATKLSYRTESAEVLSAGIALAAETIKARGGAIWLPTANGRLEIASALEAHSGESGRIAGPPSVPDDILESLQSARPILIRDCEAAGLALDGEDWSTIHQEAVLVPLLSRGARIGLMGLYGERGSISLEPKLQLLQSIGAQLGVVLENSRLYEEASRLADHDAMTGLLNQRGIVEWLDKELKRADRSGHSVSIAMMDIDDFKIFNDKRGRAVGDQVLCQTASLLTDTSRESDIVARYGGDEFLVVLPDTGTPGAITFSERVRAALENNPYRTPEGLAVPLRMSVGIATFPGNGLSSQELVAFAGGNLYHSKGRGGDAITVADYTNHDDPTKVGTFVALDGLVTAVDKKDNYTRRHSEEVANFALAIARSLGLSDESQRMLRIAGLLHDVGKIGVPDRLLRKPGKLDDKELAVVRQHVLIGEMVIKGVANIPDLVSAVGSHHERFDGTGYPRGYVGAQIPLLGRILAVADAYSTMISERPYHKALTTQEAKAELLQGGGTQFDPEVVQAFVKALPAASPEGREAAS
ncbi:MAG: diguanylate cyclase [Chloroflexi bacterium]|nr:diguanylate cyclase [Chloroflexota bacterium]